MKSTVKLVKRFVITLLLSLVVLLISNVVLLVTVVWKETGRNTVGYHRAEELAGYLTESEGGGWQLSAEGEALLDMGDAWAVLVQDGTGDVIWHSENLPAEIPLHYSVSDISWYTRGYIADYPTTTASKGNDLVIVGNSKESYWKDMYPVFSLGLIKNSPRYVLMFLGANLAIVLVIYVIVTSGILRSVKPIVQGIEALPEGREVHVRETGLLSELAASINRASEKLRVQEYELQRKEQARANWISGVSHDIRTPLSMVMGYAAELEESREAPEDVRKKAGIIRLQSLRMKNLVSDLNLASKLEYQMQTLRAEELSLATLLREIAAEFVDLDAEGKYPVEFIAGTEYNGQYRIRGDKELLKRAVENLLLNAQIHNPEGCSIRIELSGGVEVKEILVEDDGVGVTEEQLEKLKSTSHYLLNDGSAGEQRHGLGLLIVQQIAAAHGGEVTFGHGREGRGFRVAVTLKGCRESETGGRMDVSDTDH